jgi:hypothetical protein
MKKMNKIYEAPKAETIEMLNTVVVVMSDTTTGGGGGMNEGDENNDQ